VPFEKLSSQYWGLSNTYMSSRKRKGDTGIYEAQMSPLEDVGADYCSIGKSEILFRLNMNAYVL
jgi:hypothetical protein